MATIPEMASVVPDAGEEKGGLDGEGLPDADGLSREERVTEHVSRDFYERFVRQAATATANSNPGELSVVQQVSLEESLLDDFFAQCRTEYPPAIEPPLNSESKPIDSEAVSAPASSKRFDPPAPPSAKLNQPSSDPHWFETLRADKPHVNPLFASDANFPVVRFEDHSESNSAELSEILNPNGIEPVPPVDITQPPESMDMLVDLRNRYAVGDFTGAHEIAEAVLAVYPDHVEAKRFKTSCCDVLTQLYAARIGPLSGVPQLAVSPADIHELDLDHRAGFVLSCIDGLSTFEEILDVSGMPHLETLRILFMLLTQRIVNVPDSPKSRRGRLR